MIESLSNPEIEKKIDKIVSDKITKTLEDGFELL